MDITERVKVTIDLNRVAGNLRSPDGAQVSEGTAKSFLKFAGFNPGADGKWVGPRAELRRFNPGEVVDVEPLRD